MTISDFGDDTDPVSALREKLKHMEARQGLAEQIIEDQFARVGPSRSIVYR